MIIRIESSGSFTLIQDEQPKPGLSVIPPWDTDFLDSQKKAPNRFVCNNCGNPRETTIKPEQECANCHDTNWKQAVEV